ncbi:MAG: hypothetical protein WC548_04225 [Candidatus Pacearchaeota archaeon]
MGKSNLIFLTFFISVAILELAGAVVWDPVAYQTTYWLNEDADYYHNFTSNLSDYSDLGYFSILDISWVDGTLGSAHSLYYWMPWNDTQYSNSTTGILRMDTANDNETGNFTINVHAQSTGQTGTSAKFNFIANATNDAPIFTNLEDSYNWSSDSSNYTITMNDEEGHYPLNFTLTPINCTHAGWSGLADDEDCEIFTIENISDSSASLGVSWDANKVGTYSFWINVTEQDHSCSPLVYCTSDYEDNWVVSEVVTLDVLSSLTVDVTNCTNQFLIEGELLSCVINVTTVNSEDELNLSSHASLQSDEYSQNLVSLREWFYSNSTNSSSGNLLSIPISINLNKSYVGNWTIDFSVNDGNGNSATEEINFSIDWVESDVTMNEFYHDAYLPVFENYSLNINASDDDLLIPDKDVKMEYLTFLSNVSWIKIVQPNIILANSNDKNYMSPVSVVIDYVSGKGECGADVNCTSMINVTDGADNVDNITFIVNFGDDSAPRWNDSNYTFANYEGNLTYLNLTEDFTSDAENDTLVFSYVSDTEFDGFNLTSGGIINFTSTDVDIGQHLVTITASDGKLSNSTVFNFTISNVNDAPNISSLTGENTSVGSISLDSAVSVNESFFITLSLQVFDDDLLVPTEQSNFYQENITINATFHNLSYVAASPNISFYLETPAEGTNPAVYAANFTPNYLNIGLYNFTINLTDSADVSDIYYFNLTINETNDFPEITDFNNLTARIDDVFFFDVNATDQEDGDDSSGNLTFVLENLTVGGNFLTIDENSGEINFPLNSSHEGEWEYRVKVNDTGEAETVKIFKLSVYGYPNITAPLGNYVFNWTENVSTGELSFGVNYSINNTNLTYRFYLDRIVYLNSTFFNYTELIDDLSLRNETNSSWIDGQNFSWYFTPNFTDESYGKHKNLTMVVFNPVYPDLNDSVNWKVNISHKNNNISFNGEISDKGPITVGSTAYVDLTEYFEDEDYLDYGTNQTFVFEIETVSGAGYISIGSSFSGWNLTIGSGTAVTEIIKVVAHEYESGVLVGNASSNEFEVEYIAPQTTPSPSPASSGGSSSATTIKIFSMRIIVPQDIILTEDNYIEVPFMLQNNGQIDILGINLSNLVLYNNEFSEDVKILMEPTYVDKLSIGESRDFVLKIAANTQKSGRYKATIYANATSPKFSDWGDFFIELKRINDTVAEQIIIFTERLIAENPECIELTELFNGARDNFENGNYTMAAKIAQEVATACEKAIRSNEQVKNKFSSFLKNNFYYLSIAVLMVLLGGFVFYIYKRIRFNKYRFEDI